MASISDRVEISTMAMTMGCGVSVRNRPTVALAPAESDIWIKPSPAEAVPAIWANGRRAMAIACGKTSPSAVVKAAMGNMIAEILVGNSTDAPHMMSDAARPRDAPISTTDSDCRETDSRALSPLPAM